MTATMTAACLLAMAGPAAAAKPETVPATERALARASASGKLTQPAALRYRSSYRKAARAARRGPAAGRVTFRALAAASDTLARRGRLTAGRLPALQATLDVNFAWFVAERRRAPWAGTRAARLPGSPLLWQFYPHAGWQLQPLANWGEVHRLLGSKRTVGQARLLADAMLAWAAPRPGGGIANEYYFAFSGQAPGWVSAMPTASAAKALALLARKTGDGYYLQAARRHALVLAAPAPGGVRLARGPGRAHLLLYSAAPDLLVANGFVSAVKSLFDYVQLTGDPRAAAVLAEAMREAERTLPLYDTGAWSLYHRGPSGTGESDLHYHRLLVEFLAGMCERVSDGPYCALAARLNSYETQPVRLGAPQVNYGRSRTTVRVRVSKRSTVRVTAWRGERRLKSVSVAAQRGRMTVTLPARRVTRVSVQAFSLTGVRSAVHASR